MEAVRGITNARVVTFGMKDTNDYYPTEMNEEDTACEDFTLTCRGEKLGRVNLIVPGEHNMMNAVAAAAAAHRPGGLTGGHLRRAGEILRGAPAL